MDARHLHVEGKISLAFFFRLFRGTQGQEGAGNGSGIDGIGGAGQGNVSLAGQQSGCGVQADPAGAGNVDLRPGMQVGEILGRSYRTIEGLHVRRKLNEIAGHKPSRQTQVARQLHQKPGGIAAGAAPQFERFFAFLNARFHANDVADVAL